MVIRFFFISVGDSFPVEAVENPLDSMPWSPPSGRAPERSFGLSGQRWIRSKTDSPRKPGRLGAGV